MFPTRVGITRAGAFGSSPVDCGGEFFASHAGCGVREDLVVFYPLRTLRQCVKLAGFYTQRH